MDPIHEDLLLDIAESSITLAFRGRGPVVPIDLPSPLDQPRGAFVTLTLDGRLNGCIGAIESSEPLASCIARLARSAAFDDPRLPATRPSDLPRLGIEISLLSVPETVECADRAQLIAQLRPGIHGLVLGAGHRQGLFLPSVWEQLPDPDDFIDHLLAKAGLQPGSWPHHLSAWRFTTQAFKRHPNPERPPG